MPFTIRLTGLFYEAESFNYWSIKQRGLVTLSTLRPLGLYRR